MANGEDRAARRREGVGDEATRDLVQEYRKQRRARNLRALGSGMQGLGRTLRGREADIDQAFIQGGLEGEDAWMTAEEKRTELRDLELQMRQEQLQRDQMELQQRTALLGFMEGAMTRKLQREEGRLNREQERALANARNALQASSNRLRASEQRTAAMVPVAEDVVQILEVEEARQRVSRYEELLSERGYVIVHGDETRAGRVLDAPIILSSQVDRVLFSDGLMQSTASPEQIRTATEEAYANQQMTGTGAGYREINRDADVVRQSLGDQAAREASEGISDYQDEAIRIATQRHADVPNNATDPLGHLRPSDRVDLESELANRGIHERIANPGAAGSPSDYAIYEQERRRNVASSGSAAIVGAQVVTANPEVFDPTEIAQIQEAARMMGYTVRSDAQGAIEAAQESAGREGVTETQEVAQAGQLSEQPVQESWLGIPGLERPSDPREETLQAMEMIAEMPELPPLQHARQQLVQSPQFLQYQQDRGYTDEGETIRQMVQETRQQDRQAARDTRRAARENRELGIVPESPEEMAQRRADQNEPREPDAPVEGAV